MLERRIRPMLEDNQGNDGVGNKYKVPLSKRRLMAGKVSIDKH